MWNVQCILAAHASLRLACLLLLFNRCDGKEKEKKASPEKDYMFDTLILLEMDLVKCVSRVWNLKLATATCSNLNPPNVDVPCICTQ